MIVDDRGRIAGQRTVTTFQASTDVAAGYDELLDRRRSQRRNHTFALAAAVVVAVFAVLSVQANLAADPQPEPMQPPPGLDIGDVPVWYDDAGLHRGDVVEQTPVDIRQQAGYGGALALVRTGAVYLDPGTRDVWFHPWGGDPRIVGHNSRSGPGGDPNGDLAVWFEANEFVVYDTAAGREISRTVQSSTVRSCYDFCAEHYPAGNTFLQVSAELVVWNSGPGENAYSHDVRTQETTVFKGPFIDVHDDVAVMADYSFNDTLVLSRPGREEARYPELEARARFSPSGSYVLSVAEHHEAAFVDTRTGGVWRVPTDYPWIAWSYGDIALVNLGDKQEKVLACDAARRTCESTPVEGSILMPTN